MSAASDTSLLGNRGMPDILDDEGRLKVDEVQRIMREENEEMDRIARANRERVVVASRPDWVVCDADGTQIHVGDLLEWVETAGRYGETRPGKGRVTEPLVTYGGIATDGGRVKTSWEWHRDEPHLEGLYCRHENHDPEHAHKTWARIVKEEA